MLPIFSLDDEQFSEIMETARKSITRYAPNWTDFNAHDPGITFLELFSWLKELQQYHLDQIGHDNRLKFLKLFGMEMRHVNPAIAFGNVTDMEESLILPEGTEFFAGDICFESIQRENLAPRRIMGGFFQEEGRRISIGNKAALDSGHMHFHIFGKEPKEGAEFYLKVDTPFRNGIAERLYVDIFDRYPVKRNPLNKEFSPLASLKWEYFSKTGWHEIKEINDGTGGFVQSGQIDLTIAGEMEKDPEEQDGYMIRVVLSKCGYDVPPVLSGISLNVIQMVQKQSFSVYQDFPINGEVEETSITFPLQTALALSGIMEIYLKTDKGWQETDMFTRKEDQVSKMTMVTLLPECPWRGKSAVRVVCFDEDFFSERFLGIGDGFPNQNVELPSSGWRYEDFTLMVKNEEGFFTDWSKCVDFHNMTPEDCCYVFDEENESISFGDCDHGMAPSGEIKVISCATSLGKGGNVKAGQISSFADSDIEAQITNRKNASEGEDYETIDECFMRFRKELHQVDRAITYRDYETICRRTPGLLISNCKAIPASKIPRNDGSVEENCVSVVVQPYTGEKKKELSPAYIKNLKRQFADKHLIGTKVNILSPEYIGIVLFAEIGVKPYYRDAKEQIRAIADKYFSDENWEFGKVVSYSEIYGIIDTLDCVSGIHSLAIDAQGKGIKRSIGGDVILPPNGMAYLKEAEIITSAVE